MHFNNDSDKADVEDLMLSKFNIHRLGFVSLSVLDILNV